jgi:hypothetical protein
MGLEGFKTGLATNREVDDDGSITVPAIFLFTLFPDDFN